MKQVGRNDPCPCGSGEKYKKCCYSNTTSIENARTAKQEKTFNELVYKLQRFFDEEYGPDGFQVAVDEFMLWTDQPVIEEDLVTSVSWLTPWIMFTWIPDQQDHKTKKDWPEIPVAKNYLVHKAKSVTPKEKILIEAICEAPYSYLQILSVKNQTLIVRDLLLDKEVTITDQQTDLYDKGIVLMAQVYEQNGRKYFAGISGHTLHKSMIPEILMFKENTLEPMAWTEKLTRDSLLDLDIEIRDFYLRLITEPQAPLTLPAMSNFNNESIEFHRVEYRFNGDFEEAVDKLATLSPMSKDELHQMEVRQPSGRTLVFPWLDKKQAKKSLGTNSIMGEIELTEDRLKFSVNSSERMESLQRKLKHRLGKSLELVSHDRSTLEDEFIKLEQLPKEELESRRAEQEQLMQEPEVREKIQQMAKQHWENWYSEPIPALEGMTPVDASKSKKGRQLLESLLDDYNSYPPNTNLFAPDLDEIRRRLGLK